MRRKFLAAITFIFLFTVTFALLSLNPTNTEKEQHTKKNSSSRLSSTLITDKVQPSNDVEVETKGVFVARVIDGDTIEIEGGQKVRYIGVDTPETVDPRTSVQCYGKEAAAKNKKLVEGKKVRL
jgi:endonuclease YncB( thermonuclease family)